MNLINAGRILINFCFLALMAAGLTSCTLGTEIKGLLAGGSDGSIDSPDTNTQKIEISNSIESIEIWEGETYVFVLVLSEPTKEDISFQWSLDGSLQDFEALSGEVNLTKGQSSFNVVIKTVNDPVYEPTKNFQLSVSSSQLKNDYVVPIILKDDDPKPKLFIDVPQLYIAEGESTNLKIRLDGLSSSEVSFTLNLTGGTAVLGTDYTASPAGDYIIPPGQRILEIPFSTIDNAVATMTRTLNLSIDNLVGADAGAATSTINIIDNDMAHNVLTYWSPQYQEVSEDVGTVSVDLLLNLPFGADITVTYTVGGTAANPDDHNLSGGTFVVPQGETKYTLSFDIVNDDIPNIDREITIAYAGFNYTCGGCPSLNHIGTSDPKIKILEDDALPEVTFVQAHTQVTEDVGSVSLAVALSKISKGDVTIPFTFAGTASRFHDYSTLPGTLTIPAGQLSANIVIDIIDDTRLEETETLEVVLGFANGATIKGIKKHTITILDNDVPPTISLKNVTQKEGCSAVFVAELSDPSYQPITFSFTTSDGTAIAGSDYTPVTVTRTIPPGQKAIGVAVPLIADGIADADKTFTATISSPQNATMNIATATATIKDEDHSFGKTILYDNPSTSISINSARVDDNLCHVVFLGTLENTGVINVYYQNLFGDSFFRLHPEFTDHNSDASRIFLSPEANRILMLGEFEKEGENTLVSLNIDGSDRKLIHGPNGHIVNVNLIENRSRVVYLANSSGGITATDFELYTANVDGSTARTTINDPFTNGGCVGTLPPVITSDENKVLYLADHTDLGARDLYMANSNGSGTPIRLHSQLSEGQSVKSFQVSSDGAKILVFGDLDTPGINELYTVNSDGTALNKVNETLDPDNNIYAYSLSPNGEKVTYYAAHLNPDTGIYSNKRLRVVNSDGSGLTTLRSSFSGSILYSLSWTPNSSRIVYCGNITDAMRSDLFTITPEATGDTRINSTSTTFGVSGCTLHIQSNSNKILYNWADSSHNRRTYSRGVTGGASQVLVSKNENTTSAPTLRLSPDNSEFIYIQNITTLTPQVQRIGFNNINNTNYSDITPLVTSTIADVNWQARVVLYTSTEFSGANSPFDLIIAPIPVEPLN